MRQVALEVSDVVIVVIDVVAGMQSETWRALQRARERGVRVVIVITKIDLLEITDVMKEKNKKDDDGDGADDGGGVHHPQVCVIYNQLRAAGMIPSTLSPASNFPQPQLLPSVWPVVGIVALSAHRHQHLDQLLSLLVRYAQSSRQQRTSTNISIHPPQLNSTTHNGREAIELRPNEEEKSTQQEREEEERVLVKRRGVVGVGTVLDANLTASHGLALCVLVQRGRVAVGDHYLTSLYMGKVIKIFTSPSFTFSTLTLSSCRRPIISNLSASSSSSSSSTTKTNFMTLLNTQYTSTSLAPPGTVCWYV